MNLPSHYRQLTIPALLAVLFVFSNAASGQEPVRVAVSIPPQKYFVERIGGGHVAVTVMIPPGSEPHTYEPKPRQLTGLAGTDVYFTIGIAFEDAWLERFRSVNSRMRIMATDDLVKRIPMTGHGDDSHEQGTDAVDPHIWLSPPLVMLQARVIFDTLVSLDPGHADAYAEGYRKFIGEAADLDADLRRQFMQAGERNRFIVFHPSWGYFARDYGLEQVPIEIEGRDPTSAELMSLITFARENDIGVIFVQPQFSGRSPDMIAGEIDGVVVEADPLAENWSNNLRKVALRMREALR